MSGFRSDEKHQNLTKMSLNLTKTSGSDEPSDKKIRIFSFAINFRDKLLSRICFLRPALFRIIFDFSSDNFR